MNLMPLYENVIAVSRDYGSFLANGDRYRNIGLYEGNTENAITGGRYYAYLECLSDNMNFYWTGHGLLPADRERAKPLSCSLAGDDVPIFGGYVDSHMGHFFLEVLARGIDFRKYKDNLIVFLKLRERDDLQLFYKYCSFFGLEKERIYVVDGPVIIPRLYVPEPQFFITQERILKKGDSGYIYRNPNLSSQHVSPNSFSDRFLEVHRNKGDSICPDENTVDGILYLSCVRSKNYFGEYIIHRALEASGHKVIYPEDHPWESVIELVRKYKHVVGMRGSAMHFLMFCRERKKVTYFEHMAELSHNFHNLEQLMGNDMEYIQVRVISLFDNEKTRNLFYYDDIVSFLGKLGIHDLSEEYYAYYKQVITPYYIKYWQSNL